MWPFLESRAQATSVFGSLAIRTISLFAQPLKLMLFKFSRRCNLPDPDQSPKFRLVTTSSPVLRPSIPLAQLYQLDSRCPDDYFDAPEDQIRFDDDDVETFDPHPAEIPLNVQIMPRILEDQQVLRFNCLGNFFAQVTISGPFAPVAALLCRVL
jgi:hypothetical protein